MADKETIALYDAQAETYAKFTDDVADEPVLRDFISKIPSNGYVLDLGCGPATTSAVMRKSGLKVDPVDASPEMVRLANETHNIAARIATFDEIDGQEIYDGVWANFSLLHADPAVFPNHLTAINRALKPSGVFHIAMKEGSGTKRDNLGRLYAYYSKDELKTALLGAGFKILDMATGEALGLAGDIESWIAMTGVKVGQKK